jgi:hypothetical protein
MNIKLLKELYKQAETECGWSEEKFAELIVRECMSCSQFVGITNDRIGLGPMPIRYTSMVNDQIKKHFGVEE